MSVLVSDSEYGGICNSLVDALNELSKYKKIGTIEEVSRMVNEEDVVKFYYCESEDDYFIGMRIDTFYYARYNGKSWTWEMSRFLDWNKNGLPSEPKELFFTFWLEGFLKKYHS